MSDLVTYAAGEKKCRTCGKPLDEITCSKHRTWFACGRPECNIPDHMYIPIQFLPEGKLCDLEGCNELAERRAYPIHQKRFYSSYECRLKSYSRQQGAVPARCHHCGKDLGLRIPTPSGFHYCYGHQAALRHEESEVALCGRFMEPYKVYEEWADKFYNPAEGVKKYVKRFLGFLNTETKIRKINSVTVHHIGQYNDQEKQRGTNPHIDLVKVFFDLLKKKKVYIHDNPVRPGIHYKRKDRSDPRVYLDAKVRSHLDTLEARGDTQSRAIYSIAFECGPTMAQFCNLQLPDVELGKGIVRFRDPDATSPADLYSHWAPFGDETMNWLGKWLDERPKDCGHDYVFLNTRGKQMTVWALRDRMNAVLLRKSKHREHADGVDEFSLDTLRNTNIWMFIKEGLDGSKNMRIHGIRATSTLKRFRRLMQEGEIATYMKAVSAESHWDSAGDDGESGE